MEAADLLNIAADWSHWRAPPPPSVPRSVALPAELRPDLALVVQGVRRCGKSTLLTQLMGRYDLDRKRCLFVNFEAPRLTHALDHTTLDNLVDAFERDHGGEGATYFLDEIQAVTGWQRWLRTQLDRPRGRRFVVAASNAHLPSGEFASSLTGRHLVVELFPFDFDEVRLVRPGAGVIDYLRDGGFPAPLTFVDGDQLRRAYFNDIIERDVRDRGDVDFVVLHQGEPLPVQVSWHGPEESHRKALDAFHEAHPRSHEAVFVTTESWERGLPDFPVRILSSHTPMDGRCGEL